MSGTAEPNFSKSFTKFWRSQLGPLYDYALVDEFGASDPLYGPTLEKSLDARRKTQIACCYGAPLGPLCLYRLNRHLIGNASAKIGIVGICLRASVVPTVGMFAGLCMAVYVGHCWHKLSGQNAPEAEAKFYEWLRNRASAES
ncbi:succinate dehydrogenase [Orobanche hederae]